MFAGRASTAVGHRLNSETLKKKVSSLMDDSITQLYVIWKEAGYEEIECQGLLGDIYGKVRALCTAELEAERQILEHAKLQVQVKTNDYANMCKQLGRQSNVRLSLDKDSNYTDKLAELERLIEKISVEVNERLSIINKEYQQAKDLAERLGEEPIPLSSFSGPAGTPELSDARLQLIRDYKATIHKNIEKRVEDLKRLSNDCHALMAEMSLLDNIHAQDEFMQNILSSQYNEYFELAKSRNSEKWRNKFHANDERQLKNLVSQLHAERERRRVELSTNGAEIARLWTLLRIPTTEREQFTSSFELNLSMHTLIRGRQELLRLTEVRTKSLGTVISSLRADIMAIWKELSFDTVRQQEDEFALYFVPVESLADSAVGLIQKQK
jgi:chromatin remodeling complex protein RSC6